MTSYFDEKLGVQVKVCPARRALGADDLKNWSHRRQRGLSGSDGWKERQQVKAWKKGKPLRIRSKKMRLKLARGELT